MPTPNGEQAELSVICESRPMTELT